ncbi:17-beta-hydroxysteroid dehydrogenase 14 isoform X2 [Chaetodon trifascialis]|uniref:17-beta-hydroxysteroid dehydrogenase 14 isoform X2 n=1 Tax=Chaetodon trifascialis TaxID=109706 RepID=UPI003996688D
MDTLTAWSTTLAGVSLTLLCPFSGCDAEDACSATFHFSLFSPPSDPPHKPIDDTTADEFRDLLNLNLVSYFLASKYVLPYLRQRQGNIINVSSLVGSIGQKDAAPYVATKGAIISMTKAMAVDESRYSVRVNCISPGNVLTPLWEELAAQTPDAAAAIKMGEDYQLLGRMGSEAECGLAALYLAADATFCTGIDLLLSGGAELNYGFKSQIPS